MVPRGRANPKAAPHVTWQKKTWEASRELKKATLSMDRHLAHSSATDSALGIVVAVTVDYRIAPRSIPLVSSKRAVTERIARPLKSL